MVTEMTCYTYLGHIRNPRIYAVPPNYAVFTRLYFHPKNRVKWGEYCIHYVAVTRHFIPRHFIPYYLHCGEMSQMICFVGHFIPR